MLLKPGAEIHGYEPTPEDILEIEKADLFIYNGGESEEWVKRLIDTNEIPADRTFKMMGEVELFEEETTAGLDNTDTKEKEYDEHIWTNPKNAILLVQKIAEKLSNIKNEEASSYNKNANQYVARLKKIDQDFREVVKNAKKKELIFGDRFPFLYFVREYGLSYVAAFPGCSEQTEASSSTIAQLVNKARESNVKVILKIELTSDKIAQTIANELEDARVQEFSAAHSISDEDFRKGVTYADLMEKNIKTLSEALE